MNSRILFLGTGGDVFVIGKQYRASGGIIFSIDENQFHIDPGPGSIVMAKMMGQNLRENTAIFVSKNDLFRANDVNAVISAMTHDGLDKRGVIVCPSTVCQGEYALLSKVYRNCLEKIILVDNIKKLGINNIDVNIIKLKDSLSSSCGFKFVTSKFILTYITETGYSKNIIENIGETDILILTVTDPRNIQRENFLNSLQAEEIIKKVKPQLAIITGFGSKMLASEPMYEAREIQKVTKTQIIAAKDGMTINPVSFASTVRQKNLNAYKNL